MTTCTVCGESFDGSSDRVSVCLKCAEEVEAQERGLCLEFYRSNPLAVLELE